MVHVERAGQIDRDELLPFVGRRFDERLENVPTRIVHEHRDRPEFRFNGCDRRIDARAIGDVAAEGLGDASNPANFGCDLFGGLDVEVQDSDTSAFRRKPPAGRPADATAAARQSDRFCVKTAHRRTSLDPHCRRRCFARS